jgi:hypothetical protein
MIRGFLAGREAPGLKLHCTVNTVVRVEGPQATARSYFYVLNTGGVVGAGRYLDAFTLGTEEGWRFSRRVIEALSPPCDAVLNDDNAPSGLPQRAR